MRVRTRPIATAIISAALLAGAFAGCSAAPTAPTADATFISAARAALPEAAQASDNELLEIGHRQCAEREAGATYAQVEAAQTGGVARRGEAAAFNAAAYAAFCPTFTTSS